MPGSRRYVVFRDNVCSFWYVWIFHRLSLSVYVPSGIGSGDVLFVVLCVPFVFINGYSQVKRAQLGVLRLDELYVP
jgi:hypothetical protein